jgi:hypothetical protein
LVVLTARQAELGKVCSTRYRWRCLVEELDRRRRRSGQEIELSLRRRPNAPVPLRRISEYLLLERKDRPRNATGEPPVFRQWTTGKTRQLKRREVSMDAIELRLRSANGAAALA